jgi:hypothetical protein
VKLPFLSAGSPVLLPELTCYDFSRRLPLHPRVTTGVRHVAWAWWEGVMAAPLTQDHRWERLIARLMLPSKTTDYLYQTAPWNYWSDQ